MTDYNQTDIGSGYNTASSINTELTEVATAISSKVDKSGSSMTGDLDMNSNQIINLLDATTDQEPATFSQLLGLFTSANFTSADAKFIDTVSLAKVDTSLSNGDEIILRDRANGIFDVVLTASVTPNTFDIIVSTADALISFKLRKSPIVHVRQFGATGDGSTNDNGAIQAAINFLWDTYAADQYTLTTVLKNKPHGEVHFEGALTYKITGLIVPDGIRLYGHGCTLDSSTAATMVKFQFSSTLSGYNGYTGATYYAGAHGGMNDFVLIGNDIATKGLDLFIVNWSKFNNVFVHDCVVGWYLGEVQYSMFESCFAYNGTVGWIVSGSVDDTSRLRTSIDNTFNHCSANRNSKYGWWLQDASKNSFVKCEGSLNDVVNLLIGGELNNYIHSYTVTSGGTGYPISSTQSVTISGGGGSGAKGYAVINSSGVITDIFSLESGVGYTTAPTIAVAGGGSGETVVANRVDDAGLGDLDGPTAIVRGGNTFYDWKSEINRDHVPTSGYVIWQRTGRDNAFYEANIARLSSGTVRPSTYVKFARVEDFGLSFNGFGDALGLGANIGQRPDSTSDTSLFRCNITDGIYITALTYTYANAQAFMVVNNSDVVVTDAKSHVLATDGRGKLTSSGGLQVGATATTAQLADITHQINTVGKFNGKMVKNISTSTIVWANDGTAGGVWRDHAAVLQNTPI